MSHIHLPDGILPAWLWLSGYGLTALLLAIIWRRGKTTSDPRKFALLGVFAAIMILIMMIEIPPFAFHFNLSVVTGIIIGPRLAVLAALIVNLILALIGHGGITVVGLNTLVLSTEMIVGYYAFGLLLRTRLSLANAGFSATVTGLLCGTGVGYGIIAAGSSWIDLALRYATIRVGEQFPEAHLDLIRLAAIMFGVGAIGWILEGLMSAAILASLARIRPGLVSGRDMR